MNEGAAGAQLVAMPSEERIQAIKSGRAGLLAKAEALVVDSPESEQLAWAVVNGIGELKKRIEADFGPAQQASHRAWKAIVAQKRGHLETLEEPDRVVRAKLSDWEGEKRRRQAEAERKAREEAAAVEAEARRRAQERAQKEAEDKRLEEAVEAEESGEHVQAQALLETPVEAAPVEAPTVVPAAMPERKVAGAGAMVEVWKFEITDPQAIPREYLSVNETAIRKVVGALKGATSIAGVRVYKTLEARRTRGRG